MAEQERKHRQEQSDAVESTEVEADAEASGSELTDKIDDILDEIDSVLEENAEEFVKNYVQKGGE
jgi:ubiquitin-like protein Pup